MGSETSLEQNDGTEIIDNRIICELNRAEYITFGYIRHYDRKYNHKQLFPKSIKNMIYEIVKQHNIMAWYNGHVRVKVLNKLQNDTAYIKYHKNTEQLEIESTGFHNAVISIHSNGIIEYNKYIYYINNTQQIKNIKISVRGYLFLPKNGGISLYDKDERGGILDIECTNLNMEKGSYIAACGVEYGGKIRMNIKNEWVTKYGICYICANGKICGGEIDINKRDSSIKVDGAKSKNQGSVINLNCILDCGAFMVQIPK